MPSAAVDAAFQERLADNWTSSEVFGVNGKTEPPENAAAWLIVQYPVVNAEKPALGRRYFEDGAARLVLQVRRGTELSTGLALADSLAALFRTQTFDGVETFEPSAPIIDDDNDDGNWYELVVIVPYRYQFNG